MLKKIVNRVKRQPVGWERIIGIHISDGQFVSKIHTEPVQLDNKRITQLKMGKRTRIDVSPKKIHQWPINM